MISPCPERAGGFLCLCAAVHQTPSQLTHCKALWVAESAKALSGKQNTFRKTSANLDRKLCL